MGLQDLLQRWLYFLYADDVRTPQDTPLWASTASYKDSFIFYMQMMFVLHRKHAYGLPRPVTEIDLLFYMQMMFVLHRIYLYGPPRPVTKIALLFSVLLSSFFPRVRGRCCHFSY
jgi:hypothetical protein